MDTAVLLFDARAGRLVTSDGPWQFALKAPRPPLDRWIARLWELDGSCSPSRERELPRGDISVIVNLEGRHAVVDSTDWQHEHVFKDAWVTGLQEGAAARTLVDAIRNAPTADRRLTLLGTYVSEYARRACKWDTAVQWALDRIAASRGCVPVLSLAREIGWSREHLHVAAAASAPTTVLRARAHHIRPRADGPRRLG